MAGLINIGAGLSAMGQSVADSGILAQKDALENQKMVLANTLQGNREAANIALTTQGNMQTTALQGQNQQQNTKIQGGIDLANIGAQGEQARQTQVAANKLPMSAAEIATNRAQMLSAEASMAESQKPVAGGFTGTFLARDPKSGQWGLITPGTGASNTPVDPNSNNLSSQTGLSEQAIRAGTGQLSGRYAAPYLTELQKWGEKNGVNVDTLMPQAKAANNVLQQNIQRNNQGTILENEIQGSVSNLSPMLDAAKRGDIRFVNSAEGWVAQQANNPQATQIADQINRFRGEVAGYNAVASGHLMNNGTPDPHPDDFKSADSLISNGVNSGSVDALAKSVAMSAAKNRSVLLNSIDDANKNFYSLFGAKYHTTPQPGAGSGAAPASSPGAGGGGQNSFPTPPAKAIQELKMRGPKAADQFNQIFGPGAAQSVLGGK